MNETCSVSWCVSNLITWPYHIRNLNSSTKSVLDWITFPLYILSYTESVSYNAENWILMLDSGDGISLQYEITMTTGNREGGIEIERGKKHKVSLSFSEWIQWMYTAHRSERITHMVAHHVENISNGNTWQHTEIPMSLILKNTRQNARANKSNLNISLTLAYDNFENYFELRFDLLPIRMWFKCECHWMADGCLVPYATWCIFNYFELSCSKVIE